MQMEKELIDTSKIEAISLQSRDRCGAASATVPVSYTDDPLGESHYTCIKLYYI